MTPADVREEGDWPDPAEVVGEAVEFALQFHGRLPAASRSSPRTTEKHLIRKQLHPQLAQLWEIEPELNHTLHALTLPVVEYRNGGIFPAKDGALEFFACTVGRCLYVPLITRGSELTCALDVQFLRRGQPGDLIKSSGDIDNRIKVLFDALRMPHDESECVDGEWQDRYFFCLLEDDSLITKVSIDTQRLLIPVGDVKTENEVSLYIKVTIKRLASKLRKPWMQ